MRKTTFLLVVLSLLGCDPDTETPDASVPDDTSVGDTGGSSLTAAEVAPVLENYAAILFANYSDSVTAATELDTALAPLTTGTPTEAALTNAREVWTAARLPYMETEAARFYSGPIDEEPPGYEGLINSWPMDEAYVDYVEGDADSGLINDSTVLPEITGAAIAALNGADSEANVSTGWHSIEFLLWGQDLATDGPGARPFTDFAIDGSATAENQVRRRAFLAAVSTLMIADLTSVRDAWAPTATYRTEFVALSPEEGLGRILTGMGSLAGGELAGERMNVAYTTQEQEDEHSCFSDTTLNDHLHDAIGIRNLYVGSYTRTDDTVVMGASISSLVLSRDAALDTSVRARLDAAVEAIEAIPGPFDQAILGADTAAGRVAIQAAISALRDVADAIEEVAELLDVPLTIE
jgi:putative iron-regulated protein